MTRASAGSRGGIRGMTGFFIDTQGHCFLCSNRITSTESVTIPPPHSLQYLSRYLKLNLGKVFSEEVKLPPEVVAKLEKGVLGARLCEGCAILNDRFSELCSQLEKIRMEVEDCLRGINNKFSLAGEAGKGHIGSASSTDKNLTLRIAEALRKQAIEKCSHKLNRSQPRIILKKLRMETTDVPISVDTDKDMSPIPVIEHVSEKRVPVKEEGPKVVLDSDDEDTSDGFAETLETSHYNDDAAPESLDCDLSTHPRTTNFDVKQERMEVTVGETRPSPLQKSPKPKNVDNPDYSKNTTTKKWQCNSCQKQFNKRANCILHHQRIHQKLRHKCSLCNKDFSSTGHLTRHHRRVHLGKSFQCRTCAQVFSTRYQVVVHQRASRGTCRVGSDEVEVAVTVEVAYSKQNRTRKETTGRFKCHSCPGEFTSHRARFHHNRVKHLNVRFPCSECEKSFTRQALLRDHCNKVHSASSSSAPNPKSVASPHQKSSKHNGDTTPRYNDDAPTESLKCGSTNLDTADPHASTCLDTTSTDVEQEEAEVTVLETYPLPVKKTSTKKFQCNSCQKQFTDKSMCIRHHRSVHQKLRHKCSLCNKEFCDTSILARHHNKVHLGRRFRCRTCAQVFTERYEVVVHQRESRGTCQLGIDEVEIVFSKQHNN